MARILVVGGAGYIGSHMMKTLVLQGHEAIAYDNLSTGHADAVLYGDLIAGDLADTQALASTFDSKPFDAVMHFASNIEVSESMINPRKYYLNNVMNTLNLIHVMMEKNLDKLVFSSTAAVYGIPTRTPLDENMLFKPINPYGRSKAVIEEILSDYRRAHCFANTSLRYFNAAGADPEGELGERHNPESHLIPNVIQTALGRRESVTIYGTDYDTPDGTCVRDYVHVTDLCNAHLAALNRLLSGCKGGSYNLGNGVGHSVSEVIEAVQKLSSRKIPTIRAPRRPGDPPILIADPSLAKRDLSWEPQYSSLETIVQTAFRFFEHLR